MPPRTAPAWPLSACDALRPLFLSWSRPESAVSEARAQAGVTRRASVSDGARARARERERDGQNQVIRRAREPQHPRDRDREHKRRRLGGGGGGSAAAAQGGPRRAQRLRMDMHVLQPLAEPVQRWGEERTRPPTDHLLSRIGLRAQT